MFESSFQVQLGLAGAAGILTHVLYLNRGEHHMQVTRYLQVVTLSWLSGSILLRRFNLHDAHGSWTAAVHLSTVFHAVYISGIYLSLLIYRLFVNPLNKFPGPFSTKISALAWSWRCRTGQAHIQLASLHSRYGPFVRITPGAISITDPDVVEQVQGAGTKCIKAPLYDVTKPFTSLQITRDKFEHAMRRKVWNPSFSEKALRGYNERIRGYQDLLISKLAQREGRPVNITQWLMWYSFDVMGDMAFGKSFNMLEASKNHWAIDLSFKGLTPMSWMLPMWLFRLMLAIPGAARDWFRYFDFCKNRLLERMENTPEIPDIMSAIISHHKDPKLTAEDMNWLVGDAQLIISAGSDTSAATMTGALYYLTKNPDQMEKLRQELAPLWAERPSGASGIAPEKMVNLNCLNGVINEALRLLPPVPTQMIRTTPKEGITVAGTHVPGGVDIWSSNYAMGRDEKNYVDAEKFIPERWYSRPDLVKDHRAFAPFTIGPYACIGKPLALTNIRSVIAKIVCNFDISFASGEDGSRLEGKARDHFILGLGPLDMVFKQRVI